MAISPEAGERGHKLYFDLPPRIWKLCLIQRPQAGGGGYPSTFVKQPAVPFTRVRLGAIKLLTKVSERVRLCGEGFSSIAKQAQWGNLTLKEDKMKHSIPYMRETKTGWSYNPPWIAACKPPKAITMPKPRTENSGKTIARLKKIEGDERSAYLSRKVGDYYIAATDGHRALLLLGEGNGKEMAGGFGDIPFNFVILPEQFYTAMQRAIAFTEDPWAITITINAESLTVKAEVEGNTYEEDIIAPSTAEPSVTIGLNAKYLIDALGVWPLYLHFADSEQAVVLRPDDDSWRYLLMPLQL